MTLKIDKAGRVVPPKPVRDRLRLRAGSDLEIEELIKKGSLRMRKAWGLGCVETLGA